MRVPFWLKLYGEICIGLAEGQSSEIFSFIPTNYLPCAMLLGRSGNAYNTVSDHQMYPRMSSPPVMHGVPQMYRNVCSTQVPSSCTSSTAFQASLPLELCPPELQSISLEEEELQWEEHREVQPSGVTLQTTQQGGPPRGYGVRCNAAPAGPAVGHANVSVAEHLQRTPVEELIKGGWASRDGSYMSVLPPRAAVHSQPGVMQTSKIFPGAAMKTTVDLTQDQPGYVPSSKTSSCPAAVMGTPSPLHSTVHAKPAPPLPPQIQTHHGAGMPQAPSPVSVQQAIQSSGTTTVADSVPKFLFHGARRYVLDSELPAKRQCVPESLAVRQQKQERRRTPDGSFCDAAEFRKAFGERAAFTWDQAALHYGRWFDHDDADMALQVLLSCPPSTEDAWMKSSYAVEDCQLDNLVAAAFQNHQRVMTNITAMIASTEQSADCHLALQVMSPKNQKQIMALRLLAQKYKMGLEVVHDARRGMTRWSLCRRQLQGKSSC